MILSEIVAPIGLDEFLRDYVGREFVIIKGFPRRFHSLVTWQQLSEALGRLRVNDDRVFMIRQAKRLARASYVHASKRGTGEYLDGAAVSKHIAEGASLVVNQVDELFAGVRALAESCEELFHVYVSANLYAGWCRDNAFDVHWDRHDTLILQISGRKEWKIWKPTNLPPQEGDAPPSEEPVWQGTLEDGDTLYMPRGWWHVAFPRDEPTLHITVGIRHPTGADVLMWVLDQVRESACARTDVPHLRGSNERAAWIQGLRDAWINALGTDLIERYVRSVSETAHARPIVRLPESTIATMPAVAAATPLRLSRGRRLYLQPSTAADLLSFRAQGRDWQCHESLTSALALLHHVRPCTLRDMEQAVDARARLLLHPFITALLMAGVIWADAGQGTLTDSGAPTTSPHKGTTEVRRGQIDRVRQTRNV